MLHLENFFEKSFALLLTTPSIIQKCRKRGYPKVYRDGKEFQRARR